MAENAVTVRIPLSSWLIIALALALRIPFLFAPLTYSSDIWRQADTASIAHHFVENGFHLLLPQINWGGSGPGYVETEFQIYPFLVALLYAVFGQQLWLGRLVSLLMTLPTLILFERLAQRLLDPIAALWALEFFALSPLYVRYSTAFMPEATVMLCYTAALYTFVAWVQRGHPAMLTATVVTTALAILVKPTTIHIGLVFLLVTIQRLGRGRFRRGDVWFATAAALLPALLWFTHARSLYLTYGNTFGLLSGGDSKFGNLTYWLDPGFYAAVAGLDLRWVFGYGAVVLFLIGLWSAVRERALALVPFGILVVAVYYLIVARYASEPWGLQYHVYLIPYAALAVGRGAKQVLTVRAMYGRALLLTATSTTILVAGAISYDILRAGGSPLIDCAVTVQRIVPREDGIIVSTTSRSNENGVPNNYQEPIVFFYSDRHGWSLPLDRRVPEVVEAMRAAGARYLIIPASVPLQDAPEFAAYLENSANHIDSEPQAPCTIYRLEPPSSTSH
jgi:4-amino-4-deoxy-L-arabinose transferase-like glycosyltransferase